MPRSCSSSIQSEVAWRRALRAANGAGQLDRAGVEQQLLGQRRLAGVGVRDDRERAPSRHLALELREGGSPFEGVGRIGTWF